MRGIKLNKFEYLINGNSGKIDFQENNIITGENNVGKSFLIHMLLICLGSTYTRDEFCNSLSKERQEIACTLDFTVDGTNTMGRSGSTDFKTKFIFSGNRTDAENNKPRLIVVENGSEAKCSTTEFGHKVFEILGIPKRIVWTRSLTSLRMDDLLRFFSLSQETINSIHEYSKNLQADRAPKIRVVIILLWLLNPKDELIKTLILNEDLMRRVELKEIVKAVETSIKQRSFVSNGDDIARFKDVVSQFDSFQEKQVVLKKALINVNKQISYYRVVFDANDDISLTIIEKFISEMTKLENDPKLIKFLEDNKQAIKLLQLQGREEKIKQLENKRERIISELKPIQAAEKQLFNDVNDESFPYVLNEFINHIPRDKKEKHTSEVDKIRQEYEKRYFGIIENASEVLGVSFDEVLNWKKEGGATQLIKNVLKFSNFKRVFPIDFPLIIDGILAEDFSEKNKDAKWVKVALSTNGQKIIVLTPGDEKNKELHSEAWAIIKHYMENSRIEVHEIKRKIVN